MSFSQTITVNSNELPEFTEDILTESQTEATTEANVGAPLPEALYVMTYVTIAIMVVLLMCNAVLLYYRLKQNRNTDCDNCNLPQEETMEDQKETEETETTDESSSDEYTDDTSETSSTGKECDSDSVQITLEIQNIDARNTVPEGVNESKSENFVNCDECDKVFDTKNSLMSHIVEQHTDTSMKQSEKVEMSVEIEPENVKNITSASTVINSQNVNISVSSSILLETDTSETSQVSIDMSEFISTESKLPTNILSASTVILPTQNISSDSNIVNVDRSKDMFETASSLVVENEVSKVNDSDNTPADNLLVEGQPDRSKDMFATTSSLVVENELSKVNNSENTSADSLPARADLKRKSKRRRSGKNRQKNLLLTIPCSHCDLSFASEYSLGQHLVMKHN